MEKDLNQQDDIRVLLNFAESQIKRAQEMLLAGERCELVLETILRSQRALRVIKHLMLDKQCQQSLNSILLDDCPVTRATKVRTLVELYSSLKNNET
jgi:hypothetical protein